MLVIHCLTMKSTVYTSTGSCHFQSLIVIDLFSFLSRFYLVPFALQVKTPFKRWILSTVFFIVPVFPWIISMSLAALPTVPQIDVLNTAMVSLRLLFYAFVANKLVGLTIGKLYKANDYKAGTLTTLLLVLLKYLFVLQ